MKMSISKPGKARFRGPTSSNDYNVTEDDLYLDLLNLFQESNNNKNKLREAFQAILAENIALQNYAEKLESELNELEVKLNVIDKRNISTYEELIRNNQLFKIVEEIFLLICFCIMIAGIGAFFEEQFGIKQWLGALCGSLICFVIFLPFYL